MLAFLLAEHPTRLTVDELTSALDPKDFAEKDAIRRAVARADRRRPLARRRRACRPDPRRDPLRPPGGRVMVDIAGIFGDNLARERKLAGFSQEELSVRSSLHRTEVSQLGAGPAGRAHRHADQTRRLARMRRQRAAGRDQAGSRAKPATANSASRILQTAPMPDLAPPQIRQPPASSRPRIHHGPLQPSAQPLRSLNLLPPHALSLSDVLPPEGRWRPRPPTGLASSARRADPATIESPWG